MNDRKEDLSRIKWRCRRGTKELDYLLLSYFDKYYSAASEGEKQTFQKILSEQDPTIIDYFANPQGISDTSVYQVIRIILGSTESFQIK
jgi:antitoxin CptB|tara:strand:- start:526 stop:792 length:267 start_codon:yes stop_codon:yes gene_type:complete